MSDSAIEANKTTPPAPIPASKPLTQPAKPVVVNTPALAKADEKKPDPRMVPDKDKNELEELQAKLKELVSVKPFNGYFKWEGKCTKCGWATLQMLHADAENLTARHVGQHAREV